jgi:excinuclease ABC subunit A
MQRSIRLTRVRQNNLKTITVEFPFRKLSVVTGLSGSGKSSLAFDTLYAEGQRRYVESLSTYTRQFLEKMPKPDLDSIENIPPSIALEQKNSVLNSRSTVATQTELVDYLRILFAKIGQTVCMDCGQSVQPVNSQTILEWSKNWIPHRKAYLLAPFSGFRAAEPAKKSKGKIKTKTKTEVKKNSPITATLIQTLKEQGYQRLLIQQPLSTPEIIDLDDALPDQVLQLDSSTEINLIIDRVKISQDTLDEDTRGRLLDSIQQALSVGQGRIQFLDLTPGAQNSSRTFQAGYACTQCGREHRIPEPHLFSFNSPVGACSKCSGFGFTLDLDEALIVPDPAKPLSQGAIDPFSKPSLSDWQRNLFRFSERHGISIAKRYRDLSQSEKKLLWEGDPNDSTFPGIIACFEELKKWKYKLHIRVFIRRYQSQTLCTDCQGARLKREALAVKVGTKSIAEVLNISIDAAISWLDQLEISPKERKIAREILQQVGRRLHFLHEVGVGYLTLGRQTKTLSGGEFQRINLATQLGNGLCGTLYVLDEPSIGLHAADTARLIRILQQLRDQGNSVVVVEHDLEMMKAADWLVELGPAAGRNGGQLVAQGTAEELSKNPNSLTGKYLKGTQRVLRDRGIRPPPKRWLRLLGCQENNLKNLEIQIPLDRLVVATGVSGSGKSTLIHKILFQSLSKLFYQTTEPVGRYDRLYGAEQLGGVVLLDQSPIGRSSRSNPATYLKAWDDIRKILANQSMALKRGYTPQYFSFNVDGGRCPTCKGEGEITLDMHFMAEVKIPCEECEGKRFKKNVLEVTFRGKNVDQILQTTVDEACELFFDQPNLMKKLRILKDVGLGYLQLGQSGTTLSGGESQRLKIAATLDDKTAQNLLYIFDEPTTGLHLEDVKKLMTVFHDLVESKHSVVMIEHHLDVIAQADWIIDLGPGGGIHGGELMGEGSPEKLMAQTRSITGKMLREHLGILV